MNTVDLENTDHVNPLNEACIKSSCTGADEEVFEKTTIATACEIKLF